MQPRVKHDLHLHVLVHLNTQVRNVQVSIKIILVGCFDAGFTEFTLRQPSVLGQCHGIHVSTPELYN